MLREWKGGKGGVLEGWEQPVHSSIPLLQDSNEFNYFGLISYFRFMPSRLILLSFLFAFSSFAPALHPYYVSVTEIRIDTEKKTASVSCKMFTDDLQDAMSTLYKVPVELLKKSPKVDSLISVYVKERLAVSVGTQKLDYTFIGYEIEEESAWCYFEAALSSNERSVAVKASLLYDFLAEQTNFLHCFYNSEKKSFKLTNPAQEASFSF